MSKATAQNGQFSSHVTEINGQIRTKPHLPKPQSQRDAMLRDDKLGNVYGYYFELVSSKDFQDFKRRIENIIKRLGFREYAFVRLANLEQSRELISIEAALINAYDRQGLYEYDLVLQHAMQRTEPVFRSTVTEQLFHTSLPLTDHKRCMHEANELNKRFGYYDFYNVPIKAKNGNGNVVLSVTRKGMSPTELKRKVQQCMTDLHLLCDAIDLVSTEKYPDDVLGPEDQQERVIKINPQPLRVLTMLANHDLNITEVAAKLGINVVTANRHLQAARKAFGVKTNNAAIKQGILHKLIKYE